MGNAETSPQENFLVAARVRAYIAAKGLKMSDEAIEEMNLQIRAMVDRAIHRTQANKRITLRPQDF